MKTGRNVHLVTNEWMGRWMDELTVVLSSIVITIYDLLLPGSSVPNELSSPFGD